MSTATEEHVLVIPAGEVGNIIGFVAHDDCNPTPAEIISSSKVEFRPRSLMEKDPTWKQLIPYVVIHHIDQDGQVRVFAYSRGKSGGEARLHAKRSIGIGGHISSEDGQAGSQGLYDAGMARELDEEVLIDSRQSQTVVGLLYDPSTEVGRVHLGVVHFMEVQRMRVEPREDDIADAEFVRVQDLWEKIDEFEVWSQLCIRGLYWNHIRDGAPPVIKPRTFSL